MGVTQPVLELQEEKDPQKEEEEGSLLKHSNEKNHTIHFTSFHKMWNQNINGGHFFCVALPHELTEEEKQQILHSSEFVTFFDHSSRIMERALSEQVDVFFDYSGRDLQDKEGWGECSLIWYQMWNGSGVWDVWLCLFQGVAGRGQTLPEQTVCGRTLV